MKEMVLVVADDRSPQLFKPWRRYWARSFDLFLYSMVWIAFEIGVLNIDVVLRPQTLIRNFGEWLMPFVLMLIVEPFFLSRWGTTPGKWLLGLRVTYHNGRLLSYSEAAARTESLFVHGLGLGIPFYTLLRQYLSYRELHNGLRMRWDEDTAYCLVKENDRQIIAFLAAIALTMGLVAVLYGQASLPKYRGDLTPEQFVANVNKLNRFHDWLPKHRLLEDGNWAIVFGGQPSPIDFQWELTTIAGKVTQVRFEEEIGEEGKGRIYFGRNPYYFLAIYALAGAQSGVSGWQMIIAQDWLKDWPPFQDYRFVWHGVEVRYALQYEGYDYQEDAQPVLVPNSEAANHYYHMCFTVTKL